MHSNKARPEDLQTLYETILQLNTVEECDRFFADLCTMNELRAMAQRLQVAILLREGHTFNAIIAATGASSATVARVNRCLQYGAEGYNTMLQRREAGTED